MKKILCSILLATLIMSSATCLAVDYDLPNMNYSELSALKKLVEDEINANHIASSSEKTSVESAFKKWIENQYGASNVEWPWFDYTYDKDWEYFTIETHANITKSDGGRARYDLWGGLYRDGKTYDVIYVKVGTEILLDEREETITDNRVLKLLGYAVIEEEEGIQETPVSETTSDNSTASTPTATKKPQPTATPAPEISYQRGDKSDDIKPIQQRLIDLGYLNGTADGSFGQMTEDAVKAFQKEAGLSVTGVVNKETMKTLYSANAPQAKVYRELNFQEISRDPGKYTGKYYKFSGHVLQVMENTSWFSDTVTVSLRVATKGYYDNVVFVTYERQENDSRVLEDDDVTIYGECDGLYSYTSVLGSTITLPKFSAESVSLKM